MTFKKFVLLLMVVVLLGSAPACRKQPPAEGGAFSEVFNDEPALTDDEFYGSPDFILKATVDDIKEEYFTNPDGDSAENAHVTIYNLTILEVYKGSFGDEFSYPHPFPLKIYNGEGLGKEEEFERFSLQIGQEYILGISYLNDTDPTKYYGDQGGYVIENKRNWTFTMNENGLYENMATGSNHKEWDIPTLKEKINDLYRPADQPSTPSRYSVDGIKKDPSITKDRREQFYELYRTWRVDAMYEFTPEKPMELELFKYYCAYFVTDEEKSDASMGVNYTGAAVERIAKRFGTSYGLKDDEPVFVKAGSLMSMPFAEVIGYKEETVNGKTLVTARCINYYFNDYQYLDQEHIEAEESYSIRRDMVLKGNVTGYDYFRIQDFSFYTEDSVSPTQFVSCMGDSPESLADGYQTLPEFVPAKETKPEEPLKATVTFAEKAALERVGDGVFYYGIKEFYPVIDGKKGAELRELLKTDPIAGYKVFKQGATDQENGLCENFGSGSSGPYEPDADYYRYSDYEVMKIDGIAGSYYLFCPHQTNIYSLYNSMLLMNTPEDSTIVPATTGTVHLGNNVYFYTIQRFRPTIDGKQVDFENLLRNDPQAVEKLLAQADRDAKKNLCKKDWKYDGGSTIYLYKDYTIFKIHAFNSETEDPNDFHEALVIGRAGMDFSTVFDILFNGLRYV